MKSEDLARIKEYCDEATEGPWYVDPIEGYPDDYIRTKAITPTSGNYENYIGEFSLVPKQAKNQFSLNAAFTANARTDLPAVVQYAEELEARLKATQNALNELFDKDISNLVGAKLTKALTKLEPINEGEGK